MDQGRKGMKMPIGNEKKTITKTKTSAFQDLEVRHQNRNSQDSLTAVWNWRVYLFPEIKHHQLQVFR